MIPNAVVEVLVKQLEVVDKYACDVAGMHQQLKRYTAILDKERAELNRLYTIAGTDATVEDFPCIVTVPHHSMRYLMQYGDYGLALTPILREVTL